MRYAKSYMYRICSDVRMLADYNRVYAQRKRRAWKIWDSTVDCTPSSTLASDHGTPGWPKRYIMALVAASVDRMRAHDIFTPESCSFDASRKAHQEILVFQPRHRYCRSHRWCRAMRFRSHLTFSRTTAHGRACRLPILRAPARVLDLVGRRQRRRFIGRRL